MNILLIISIVSAIMAIIGAVITKITNRGIGGKWYRNSIFWFYCTITVFSIWFWDTLIMVSWYLAVLDIGG